MRTGFTCGTIGPRTAMAILCRRAPTYVADRIGLGVMILGE
jgi:hypothetical protein